MVRRLFKDLHIPTEFAYFLYAAHALHLAVFSSTTGAP